MVNSDDNKKKTTNAEDIIDAARRTHDSASKDASLHYRDQFTSKAIIKRDSDVKIKTADELVIRVSSMKESKGYRVFTIINVIIMLFISAVTLYPFLYLVAQSFSSHTAIAKGLVTIIPVEPNIKTYTDVLTQGVFLNSYKNTIIYTIIGTASSIFLSAFLAYPLSKPHLKFNKFLTPFVIFTMYFYGGLIPNYVLMTRIGLYDKWPAFIIPGLISTYYVLLMKAFFANSPHELEEAGELDGLSQIGVFFRVVLPLSKPIIATMTLFYAVSYWNNWFNAFLYLPTKEKWPVAYYLKTLIAGSFSTNDPGATADKAYLSANIRSCAMVLMALPIICMYPIVQRYYVQGMMLGSVKE